MTSESTFSRQQVTGLVDEQAGAVHAPAVAERVAAIADDRALRLHGRTPAAGQPFVVCKQEAMSSLLEHVSGENEFEIGGVLLGNLWPENGETVVEVAATLPALNDDHGPVHFTFSADVWSHIHSEKAQRYPNLAIVGWYHTHPDLGVFCSADDAVVHSAAFNQPWHVGLVIDPVRSEGGFFGWTAGQVGSSHQALTGLEGFYEVYDCQEESLVPFKVVDAAVWTELNQPVGEVARRVFLPSTGSLYLPPVSPWWGILLGALSLLISLALLLDRVLAMGE